MKRRITLMFFLIFAVAGLTAQDVFLQDESPSTEEMAKALTEDYQPELVMTGAQTSLFEKKLGEFLVRAGKIKKMDISIRDRLHMLRQLSAQENEEMANILTRPQVKRYMKLKSELQPVAMVVDSIEH